MTNDQSTLKFCLLQHKFSYDTYFTVKVQVTYIGKPTNCIDYWNSSSTLNQVNHAEVMCQQLSAIEENTQLADYTLISGESEFPVHSQILSMRSSVFEAMFSYQNFKENKEKKIKIEDIDSNVIEAFLAYVYCRKFENWKVIAGELAIVADKVSLKAKTP